MDRKNLILNILVPTLLLTSIIGVLALYTGDNKSDNNDNIDDYTMLSKANLNPVIPTPDTIMDKNKVDTYENSIKSNLNQLKYEYIKEAEPEKVLIIEEIMGIIGSVPAVDYSEITKEQLEELVGFSNYLYGLYNEEDSEFKIDALKQGLNCLVGEEPEKLAKIIGTLEAMGIPSEEYVKDLINEMTLENFSKLSTLTEAINILEANKKEKTLKSKAVEEAETVLVEKIISGESSNVVDFLKNSFICDECLDDTISKNKVVENILNKTSSTESTENSSSDGNSSNNEQDALKPISQPVSDALESYLPDTPKDSAGGSTGDSSSSDGGSVGEGTKGQGKSPNNESLPQTGHSETSNFGLILIYFSIYCYIRSKNYKSIS